MRYERVLRLASIATVLASAPQLAAQGARFGTGCQGAGGQTPELTLDRSAASLRVAAGPSQEGVFALGLSTARWSSAALPLDLGPFGSPGCRLLVSPEMLIPFRTDDNGNASVAVPASALASDLVAQAILVDAASDATARAGQAVSVSNGLYLGIRERLPVFKLEAPTVASRERLDAMLASLSPTGDIASAVDRDGPGTIGRRAMAKEIEAYAASGGLFMRDAEKLWNPQLQPVLPSEAEARVIAERFLARNRMLPANTERTQVDFSCFTETGVSEDRPGPLTKTILDRQINYDVRLLVEQDGQVVPLPVIGGGGNFKVSVGHAGEIVGYHGVWRPIAGIESHEEIMSKADAEAEYKANAKLLNLISVEAHLAYYSAPAFERQTHLAPVWVIKAVAMMNGVATPMRNAIIAATKYGPSFVEAPQELRQEPQPGPLAAFNGGTSWLGTPYGLPGSQGNAGGFVNGINGMSYAGWGMKFNFGNSAAWESDFNSNDDIYVDACDFVFYTGHANQDGWQLANGFMDFNKVRLNPENPGDHYGQLQLEWLIIAACGPHQSTHFRTAGTTNAFDRWRGTFDGLHSFLGYGAVTFDNTSEGGRVVQLTQGGWNVVDAWFRTAQEVQPATNGWAQPDGTTIFVTAMYAHTGDHATRYDQIWGIGTVYGDARVPNQARHFLWSGT